MAMTYLVVMVGKQSYFLTSHLAQPTAVKVMVEVHI